MDSSSNRYHKKGDNKFNIGDQVEVCSDDEGFRGAWYVASVLKSISSSRSTGSYPKRKAGVLVEYHSLLSDADHNMKLTESVEVSYIRPLPPVSDGSWYEPYDVVDAFHRDGWWKGVVSDVFEYNGSNETKYTVVFEDPFERIDFFAKELRFHLEWIDGSWFKPPKQTEIPTGVQSTHADSNAREPEVAVNAESSTKTPDDTLKSLRGKSREKLAIKRSRKNLLEHSANSHSKSPSKRTKKTLPKSEDALSCLAENLNNENSVKPLLLEACHVELTPIQTTNQELQVAGGVLTKCSTNNMVDDTPSSCSDIPFTAINNQDVGSENEAAGSLEKSESQMNSQVTGGEDKNKEDSAEIFVDKQHKEGNTESESENVKESSLINVPGTTELTESRGMPFVKSSSFWNIIESLEIFRVLPQKPHFGPLVEYKEATREGLAIGYMFTFANLIEKTSKLRVDNSREEINSYLEVFADLKTLGFNVKAVEDRLQKLMSIKDRFEQLEDESKNFRIQLTECEDEMTKLEEDIVKTDRLISELEEKRAMKVSTKVMKDSKLVALQAGVDVINEDIVKMKHEFESQAAASW
ncbi:DUF724 domain-containing protein 3-like [Mercurialis annua]|uniref:DUF724 domain-containing protein 3-like n=1 Tax=Mercurialis annua TaxID=3986 RepID=UPI00215F83EE|nr:DUF724 domain-containing protein 3-like [Mercurialis annua]